jgi:hypothetical protein
MLPASLRVAALALAVAAGATAASEDARPASLECAAARVDYRPFTGRGVDADLGRLPRVSAGARRDRLDGFLFYYASAPWAKEGLAAARIYAGGQDPGGAYAMKILWRAFGHLRTRWLLVSGRRLDAAGSFQQGFRGYGYFPSIVEIPAPGCWRLDIRAGTGRWALTFLAV